MRSSVIASLAVCGIAAVSHADLTSVTWITGGDGLLTHDSVSGLYWVDWTQGMHLSRNAMEAEFTNPNSPYFGLRYATVQELHALAANAGAPNPGGRTSGNIPAVTDLLSLLGANNFFGFLGAGNSSAAFLDGSSGGWANFGVLTIETFDNPLTAKAGEIGSANPAVAGLGHALVSTVPTPGAAAFLGLGALAAARRRR